MKRNLSLSERVSKRSKKRRAAFATDCGGRIPIGAVWAIIKRLVPLSVDQSAFDQAALSAKLAGFVGTSHRLGVTSRNKYPRKTRCVCAIRASTASVE